MSAVCDVCFRHCQIGEGETGFCSARRCVNGEVVCGSYGKLTSLALDPIEKKPLRRFYPGSLVISVGSYGCSLDCPYCQNSSISRKTDDTGTRFVSPEELVRITKEAGSRYPDVIGVAYTYNEPLTFWEYVRDAGRLVHEAGMKNVLVTSGNGSLRVLEEILPYMDAMNIDLKGFRASYYRNFLHGDLTMVKEFIREAASRCHVELTTLVVPGMNDSEEEIRDASAWIASLDGKGEIPYHLSRYFPRYHLDIPATPIERVYHLADIARERLRYVYTGNC